MTLFESKTNRVNRVEAPWLGRNGECVRDYGTDGTVCSIRDVGTVRTGTGSWNLSERLENRRPHRGANDLGNAVLVRRETRGDLGSICSCRCPRGQKDDQKNHNVARSKFRSRHDCRSWKLHRENRCSADVCWWREW